MQEIFKDILLIIGTVTFIGWFLDKILSLASTLVYRPEDKDKNDT